MTALSLILVTWNAKHYVHECLVSLCQQELSVNAEIIVVDNASSDGTPAMVRTEFPHIMLVENPTNLGFSTANNIGIKKARGEYLCLINSDVNVPPHCLQTIYNFMVQHPKIGVLGPRMLTPEGAIGRSYMRFPTLWNCMCSALSLSKVCRNNTLCGGVLMPDFDNERTAEVDVLNGWFLVVRRQALDQVGTLDERFFMYGEDIDWCYRFHKAGWKRIYFAGVSALHYGGASSKRASAQLYIEMQRANLQYWQKHHSRVGVIGYCLTMLVHQIIRAVAYGLIYIFSGSGRVEAAGKVKRSAACIAWLIGLRAA
jgi:GT2 family glycosyltransferase